MGNLRGLGTALKVGAVIALVTKYAQVTDQIKQANAQLKLATRTQTELNQASAAAYQIAQKNGTAYGATATLLAKNLKAANGLGIAGAKAQMMAQAATRAVAAGIRVSGTSAQEAQGSLLQLGQALASGTLRGDELNSVMEGMPGLAEGLAKAMGKTTGELRKLGAEGKLTSGAVLEGLVKAMPDLERLAAMIPLTFGQAFEKVKNAGANLLGKFDQGTSLSSGMIASLDLIAKALDGIAEHSEAVSNIVIGVLVAMGLSAASAFRASATAAAADAAAKLADLTATQALAVAEAELAAVQVARARASMGSAGAGATAAAVKNAELAAAKVAALNAEVATASTAVAGATARSGMFGAAMVRAASLGRAALALVGGPIGLIVTALAAVVLWAGKAALGFQPIKGEAGTVGDYIAVAFEDATKWAGDKIAELSTWAGKKFTDIGGYVRPVAVFIVNAFLNVARGVAGAVQGIVSAWEAGANNIKSIVAGIGKDASEAMKGNFTTANTQAAIAGSVSIGAAFGKGVQEGFDGTFKGLTGEKVVGDTINLVKSIPGRIADAAKASGYRDRANERGNARAAAGEGGLGDLGKPMTPEEKKAKDEEKKAKDETTFDDILKDAKEAAYLASLNTAEAERTSAVFAAQKTLKRDLTKAEMILLGTAIDLKRANEANLALDNARLDVIEGAAKARADAAAEARRDVGDFAGAAAITAELAVQEKLNQAKRDGVTLDQAKLEAYRQAVLAASQETEVIRQQQESRRALKAIADEARNSIREAISGGIYDAMSGKLSIKGLFKTFGNILKKQFAEQVTYAIFQGAGAEQSAVTAQAVNLVTPAANALAAATNRVTQAMAGPAANDNPVAEALTNGATQVETATGQLSGVLGGAVKPLGEAITGILSMFGLMGKGTLMGGGQSAPQTGIGRFLGPQGPLTKGLDKLAGALGIKSKTNADGTTTSAGSSMLGKVGAGLGTGMMAGQLVGMLGLKTSSTGSALGGVAGSFIGGPLGAAIGGALGGVLGGMFKKAKTGTATITSATSATTAGGNNSKARAAAGSAAGTVQQQLAQYAEALGAGVGDFGKITIGTRDGNWRVNTTGTSTKKKKGAEDFGDDAQAAITFAVQEAIKRGAFTGLSKGIEEAIKSGRASVEEAVSFLETSKDVSRQVKALTDPVGAAIDELDDKFNALRKQYTKFGESTVDLEKLYQSERVKVIADATKNELASLVAFRDELRGGDLGDRSLTDQVGFQDKAFRAIEEAKAAGGPVDADQVNTVGRALLEATRELEGNTPAYQQQVDRVMNLLNGVIEAGDNPNVAVLNSSQPVVEAVGGTTVAVQEQTDAIVGAVNNLAQQSIRNNAALEAALAALGFAPGTSESDFYKAVNF